MIDPALIDENSPDWILIEKEMDASNLEMVRREIATAARSWLGTPFYPHIGKKGIGADCVNFVLAVYQEAGVIPSDVKLPAYSLSGGYHRDSSLILPFIRSRPELVEESEYALGSVVTFQMGRVEHHVGILTGETLFIHAIRGYGVIECDLRDSTWRSRLRSSWGPKIL